MISISFVQANLLTSIEDARLTGREFGAANEEIS